MKFGIKANLSTRSCPDISEFVRKLEIAQNAKSCSKYEKLPIVASSFGRIMREPLFERVNVNVNIILSTPLGAFQG